MLLLRALLLLTAYDMLVLFRGFRAVHSTVQSWQTAKKHADDTNIGVVVKAVNYACIWYPKRALCLQRSFVLTCMLRRNGINAQMILGASRIPFRAHAWVEVEGRAINERPMPKNDFAIWERC